ncbi:MAG TPA: hypothetical protein IAD26_02045 [Candidatus Limenecus avicola]|uniref:Uncharacterized protein n=1 Tax=Candidatus Limenecus avicola TaxID=2840847 RepID=A0A9D1SQD2_9CLOT|nr:hypothetical protein [Candidatus Limenecus avicola]
MRIKHSDGFEVTVNKPLDFKSKSLGLTKQQSLALGYMGKKSLLVTFQSIYT